LSSPTVSIQLWNINRINAVQNGHLGKERMRNATVSGL
jgi:hypothetical protein